MDRWARRMAASVANRLVFGLEIVRTILIRIASKVITILPPQMGYARRLVGVAHRRALCLDVPAGPPRFPCRIGRM